MLVNGKEIEILAPAGDFENLKTAILSGADSVYFGLSNFNARRNAENFGSFEKVKEAVDFCHLRGKKAHVTLNTLVYDNEIDELIKEIEIINKVGFDAIIVQDLGVVNILKQISKVPLHASTQLSVHNVSDAKMLKDMGFERVVLSRELSLKEIKRIIDEVDVEVEIFIHGALCMSVSGQCYFSSALGERSGNRGLCAGVCRLPFYVKEEGRYNLSLKDVCYIDYIEEFASMGIASLKIEGRMKSSEYVKTVVNEVKNRVINSTFDKSLLESVFSRNGFTDGYLTGQRKDMFGIRRDSDKFYTKKVSKEVKNIDIKEEKIKIKIKYDFSLNKKAHVEVIDEDNNRVYVEGDFLEEAKSKPVLKDNIEKNLCKLGESIYKVDYIGGKADENIFIPISKINEIRRLAVDELNKIRLGKFNTYDIGELQSLKTKKHSEKGCNMAVLYDVSSLNKSMLEFFDVVFVPLFQLEDVDVALLEKYKDKIGVEVPRIYFDEESIIKEYLSKAYEKGIKKGLAHTIGKMSLVNDIGFDLYTGFGSNITNSYSVDILEEYFDNLKNVTVSFENTINNINKIKSNTSLSAVVYGFLPLMTTRNCPIKEEIGCGNCNKNQSLTDRMGKQFKVKCNGQTSEIFNTYPLCIFEKIDKLDKSINRVFLFTNEIDKQVDKIIKNYKDKENIPDSTKGCYFRKLV